MKTLIVEDQLDLIELINEIRHKKTDVVIALNVVEALALLERETIGRVYCDFHGIEKNGLSAHDVIRACMAKGITSKLTSSDHRMVEAFGAEYGIASVTKLDMLSEI